jgi:cellobiose phosphorylase
LGVLQPGETRRVVTQLGQAKTLEAARSQIQRFRNPEAVEAELEKTASFWNDYLSALQVKTPDESMTVMLNLYNPRQCYITKTWSRYLSYYQLGLGSRGIGVRDSYQDVISVMAFVPNEVRNFS